MDTQLLNELTSRFEALRKELTFKASFEELDGVFFISDFVADKGFVSEHVERQVSGRIVDLYMMWYGYLHGLVMPNPNNMASITESHLLSESERATVMRVMSKMLTLSSQNILIGLTKDKKQQTAFFDDALAVWKEIKPDLESVMKRIHAGWKDWKPQQQKQQDTFFG